MSRKSNSRSEGKVNAVGSKGTPAITMDSVTSEGDEVNIIVRVGHNLDSLTDAINALQHHQTLFGKWKKKHPESSSDFDIAAQNIQNIEHFLITFRDTEYKNLLSEVKTLQETLEGLKIKYAGLEKRLEDEVGARLKLQADLEKRLEDEVGARLKLQADFDEYKLETEQAQHKQQQLICAFDLVKMYRVYYLENIVGNWGNFCETYQTYADEVEDGERTQDEFDAYCKSIDDRLGNGLRIATIMTLRDDRNKIAHTDIRSAKKQEEFVKNCVALQFIDPVVGEVTSKILLDLQKVQKFRRMND
jgi:predicted RNase H-like nuclease (RuvC/YqgF family)